MTGFTSITPRVDNSITFRGATGEVVLKFSADGKVTSPSDLPVDEKAKAVIEAITRLWRPHLAGWRPISEHDGSETPVDLWNDGSNGVEPRRFAGFALVNGHWVRPEGYPVVQRRLTFRPTHFKPIERGPLVEGVTCDLLDRF